MTMEQRQHLRGMEIRVRKDGYRTLFSYFNVAGVAEAGLYVSTSKLNHPRPTVSRFLRNQEVKDIGVHHEGQYIGVEAWLQSRDES